MAVATLPLLAPLASFFDAFLPKIRNRYIALQRTSPSVVAILRNPGLLALETQTINP